MAAEKVTKMTPKGDVSALFSDWLALEKKLEGMRTIEEEKGEVAKRIFAARGNKPFNRDGVQYRAVERINKEKAEDGSEKEVSRSYSIRVLARDSDSI